MTMYDRDLFEERIEAYLDGELSDEDARRLEAFAAVNAEAGRELHLAKAVQERIRAMPQPICPPDVTRSVLAEARADARRSFVARLRSAASESWTTILRPSLTMGVFVALIVAGTLIGRSPSAYSPYDEPHAAGETTAAAATPQEVAQGLDDAKWALAYLSNVGRRTATTIRDDVLDEHVVRPVNRAINAAFDDEEPSIQ